jgi:YggT family protein
VGTVISTVLGALSYLCFLYLVLLLARFIVDWVRMFARSWRPTGTAAVGIEWVYVSTDRPVRLFRKLIPPLRIGGLSLDLSIWVLLIVTYIVYRVLYGYSH